MAMFEKIERDFIQRTLYIIEQYDEHVLSKVDADDQYEVTLLINCLLGLLIYPQQLAHKQSWQNWLPNQPVIMVCNLWGIEREYIVSPGHRHMTESEKNQATAEGRKIEEVPITHHELKVHNLIRQMRNAAGHAGILVSKSEENPDQIGYVEFKNEKYTDGFHLKLPVAVLRSLVTELAKSALRIIDSRS